MAAASLLLLLLTIQGGRGSDTYCTEQRGTAIVQDKGSVTISCNFTYPQNKDKSIDVRVSWRESGLERCGNGSIIYNHTDGRTHKDYIGRISPVGNPNKDGKATITIKDLRKTDGPMFCCRIEIYEGSNYIQGWQNRPGTFIQFKDMSSVEQADVVPAIIGGDIIIPCVVNYKGSSIIEEVSWTAGSSDLCVENNDRIVVREDGDSTQMGGRWSVVDFPQDLSLRINTVTLGDARHYCCRVKLKTKPRDRSSVSPIHGTEVVLVAESNDPGLEVVQPETTSSDTDGSATLRCSFTHQSDTDPLWTEVFWKVGNLPGDYAYHPFTSLVHPRYRGRTELRGPADLHIKGITVTDNTTYYCMVMLKFCIGNNKTSSTLQYGGGTKLEVTDTLQNANPNADIWVYILAAVLLGVLIMCAIVFIILKKKGVICQKHSGREDDKYLTSDIALRDQNPTSNVQAPRATSGNPPMAPEDSGGILYAQLNVSSLNQDRSNGGKKNKSDNDSQVLYAAVKSPAAPQDIYSTVK